MSSRPPLNIYQAQVFPPDRDDEKRRFPASPQAEECKKKINKNNGKEILLRSRPSARDVSRWTESKLPIPVLFPSPPRFAFHSFAACSARDITLTSESCAHLRRRRERARLLRRGQMVNLVLPCTPRKSVIGPIDASLLGVGRLFEDVRKESTS